VLTENEKKVLRLLLTAIDIDYSINEIAKDCNLSPNGALKILRKLEAEGVLEAKKIANIKSYKLNFENENTINILILALVNKLKGRLKYRREDFETLRQIVKACIVFGSYTSLKKEPNDLDVLFILDKDKFKDYKRRLDDIKDTIPAKVHDILQTEEDLVNNILTKDKIVMNILKNGIVLWGQKIIIEVVKDAHQRKTK
jgi:DNA-binding Lrp family transcriptional regulator